MAAGNWFITTRQQSLNNDGAGEGEVSGGGSLLLSAAGSAVELIDAAPRELEEAIDEQIAAAYATSSRH
jgi:hypothetical protein